MIPLDIELDVSVRVSEETGNVYTLRSPLTLAVCSGSRPCMLTIPAGFASDGASVPRFFWRCVFPPGHPGAMPAALAHDWLYRRDVSGWTRLMADTLFAVLLLVCGIAWHRAALAFLGVRLFGRRAWISGGG